MLQFRYSLIHNLSFVYPPFNHDMIHPYRTPADTNDARAMASHADMSSINHDELRLRLLRGHPSDPTPVGGRRRCLRIPTVKHSFAKQRLGKLCYRFDGRSGNARYNKLPGVCQKRVHFFVSWMLDGVNQHIESIGHWDGFEWRRRLPETYYFIGKFLLFFHDSRAAGSSRSGVDELPIEEGESTNLRIECSPQWTR